MWLVVVAAGAGFGPAASLDLVEDAAAVGVPTGSTASAASCSCGELLGALVDKVETNYPGYHMEVRGRPAEEEYRRHVAAMRAEAAAVDGIACVRVLQNYVAWFGDGHLFVGGRPPIPTAEDSARLRDRAPRLDRSEAEVLARLDAGGVLDPIEGIWVDPAGLRLAIVPTGARTFAAVVLESTSAAWEPGDVKAELEALPDGSYDAILYDDAGIWGRLLSVFPIRLNALSVAIA